MVINFKGQDTELKFTFNSFKFMTEFNVADLENLDSNPFKFAVVLETLLLGALNSNPKAKVTASDVDEFLEEYSKEHDLSELITSLMDALQNSSFFKSLQKKQ